jgi:thiol-disulfide isomerase/thioredoxin
MTAQTDSIIVTGKFSEDLLSSEWFTRWNSSSAAYLPDAETTNALKSSNKTGISVIVYLGTWCDDSKTHVPAFIQVAQFAQLPFTLIGVNREKECPFEKKACKSWDITHVPTFVVLKDGIELGRIIETPQQSIEKDLLSILKK